MADPFWSTALNAASTAGDLPGLADILLTVSEQLRPQFMIGQGNPLPHGRPPAPGLIAAGRRILELVPDESSIENVWAWRALGLCAAATWSRTAPGDRDDKLNAGLALMEQAAQLCEGRDAILEWFVGHRLSMRQRDTLKPDAGLESALAMVAIVESGRADDPSASVLRRMVAHPENFRWGTDARNWLIPIEGVVGA